MVVHITPISFIFSSMDQKEARQSNFLAQQHKHRRDCSFYLVTEEEQYHPEISCPLALAKDVVPTPRAPSLTRRTLRSFKTRWHIVTSFSWPVKSGNVERVIGDVCKGSSLKPKACQSKDYFSFFDMKQL